MVAFNYDSLYARVAIRSSVREALQMPKTFATWGKQHLLKHPEMAHQPARQWIAAFLLDITGIQWIVDADSLDFVAMPRHNPQKLMQANEQTTDDPPLPLHPWTEELTRDDVPGTEVLHFIAATLSPLNGDLRAPGKTSVAALAS